MSEMLELDGAGVMPEDIPELEYDFLGECNLIEELLGHKFTDRVEE